jgi:hypothetical protein
VGGVGKGMDVLLAVCFFSVGAYIKAIENLAKC